MKKLQKVAEFLKKEGLAELPIFNGASGLEGELENIYHKDNITVFVCREVGYLEIFGLNDKEFQYFMILLTGEDSNGN